MKPKTLNILYWSFTIFFALLLIMDGIGGISGSEDGKTAMRQLGYPEYIMPVTGISKLLAVIAILQTKFITIKEWAFAGLTFNFIMASVSWAIVGQPLFFVLFPMIALIIMLVPYFLWKKVLALKAAGVSLKSTQPLRAAYSA